MRRGNMLIWMTVSIAAVVMLLSLAMDYGHVEVVKTELRRAADAAARAAITDLASGGVTAAQQTAMSVAGSNTADGTPVTISPGSDIEYLTWDATKHSGTILTGTARASANAIRVTARRTAANGNAVPLIFARILGAKTCDVKASSTAMAAQGGSFGIVGLNYINMSSKKTDKYNSKKGKYDPTTASQGNIGSNGNITLKQYVTVNGDARPGVGKSVAMDGTCTVTGATNPLKTALSYSMPSAGSAQNNNNNTQFGKYITTKKDFSMSSGTLTLTGGTYYVRNFSLTGTATITFTGPAVLYVSGALNISGGITTNLGVANQLQINMVSNGTATFAGSAAFCGNFYGPKSAFSISGNSDYFGTIVALSVDCSGGGGIHYDSADDPSNGGVSLVE